MEARVKEKMGLIYRWSHKMVGRCSLSNL